MKKLKFKKSPFQYNAFSLRKRILTLFVIISLLFCALNARLCYVSVAKSKELSQKATSQWTRGLSLTAERGKIYDSDGATLAVSYTTYDVYVRAKEIDKPEEVATFLSSLLGVDKQKTLQKCQNKNVSESLVKLSVDEDVALKIKTSGFKGVFLGENIKRYYPYGDLLTQVLGFVTVDGQGQAGLEAYYNNYLKGSDGKYLVQSDLVGRQLENTQDIFVDSIAGMNLELTIDVDLQIACEQALAQVCSDHKPKSATAIIMDPNTGEILAMSTKPSFDLNNIPRDDVSALMQMTKNSTVVDVFEPGSTFKILTVAAALEEGLTSLSDTFYDPGYRIVDGQKIKCWKTIGHGNETLVEGFVNSCNSVFMDLALRLGTDKFYDYLKSFGIGEKTGVDISGESGGILIGQDDVKRVDLARIGFGQSVAVTPLQLLTAFCSAINGGQLLVPYLVKSVSEGKDVIASQQKQVRANVLSPKTSQLINTLLLAQTTKNGTTTFVPGYDIGGKTGTAQKYENGSIARGKYISSFFGTYPAQNPQYALLLLVDEPSQGQYYGSVVAAPYAKMIFEKMFSALQILPNENEGSDKEKLEKTIEMPNVVGMSLADACALLKSLSLNVEIDGEGGIVVSQFPPSGTLLHAHQTVVLSVANTS